MDTSVAEESIPTYEEVCWKSKPYRTMTYPPRTQPHHHSIPAPRTRSKKGAPLDPYDLSRRLRAHLAQQKALAEHRRASLSSTSTDPYHHTPQVAALSFEHTATAEKLRNVHKLSEPALKNLGYMTIDEGGDGLGGCGSGYIYQKPGTLLQKTQIYDHATADKTKLRNRNQYQWTSALERAAELDAERDLYRCPRRTFNSDVPVVHKSRAGVRPMSMGDYLPWEEKEEREEREVKEVKREKNDRHDWTQRDESEETRRSMRERVGPLLSLKLKKGKGLEEGEGGKTKSLVRSPIRVSFFGRFKRSSPSHGS